jgi:hypothetical protein
MPFEVVQSQGCEGRGRAAGRTDSGLGWSDRAGRGVDPQQVVGALRINIG